MKDVLSKGTTYTLLIMGSMLMLLPFLWMISTSLQTAYEVTAMPFVWIPATPRWENFSDALQIAPFERFFINSIIVTLLSTLGVLITTTLASYAFARLEFLGKDILFAMLLGTMMVPSEVLLIPNFVTIANLEWVNTYRALIIPWSANVVSIFLLRQFFLKIPRQLAYAAKVDGCTDARFLFFVMVPLAKPVLVTIAIMNIINSWNAFLWPLLMTNSREMRTLPVGLALFRNEAGVVYELLMAASLMVVLPMIILFFILQKHIVEGVSRSGLKG